MADVICLGELLIDFISESLGLDLEHSIMFRRAPGGAPANVACGVVKLGLSAAFVGKVGDDAFGRFLQGVLAHVGVDTSHLLKTAEARTTLVFVARHADGHKDMLFYRHPGADMLLSAAEIDVPWLSRARAFHFGSISMMDPLSREATVAAARAARQAGLLVSFDPNHRPGLWASDANAHSAIDEGLGLADLVKISDEEWTFVTGTDDFTIGAQQVLARGPKLLVISRGAAGCSFYGQGSAAGEVPGFGVEAVETTGAGDGFLASLLVDLLAERKGGRELAALDQDRLYRICRRANAVGALTCTRSGAIPGLPTRREVDSFLAEMKP